MGSPPCAHPFGSGARCRDPGLRCTKTLLGSLARRKVAAVADDTLYDVVTAKGLDALNTAIAHKSMADQVSETLRIMILSRQLTPGLRVTQTELAEMLGVSTMPIREALLRLGSEGLIISSANRSFEVANPTEKGIRDVYWIHGVLAGELAARAWDNKSDALITTLQQEHDAYATLFKPGDRGSLTEANRRFHTAINSVSAPPTIGVVLRNTLHYFPCRRRLKDDPVSSKRGQNSAVVDIPDFSLEVDGWPELASHWQTDLIEQFTRGSREQARQVSIGQSRTAGELFIVAYGSPNPAKVAVTGRR
jgi:DNA-binding GntR family transcriptional regulator